MFIWRNSVVQCRFKGSLTVWVREDFLLLCHCQLDPLYSSQDCQTDGNAWFWTGRAKQTTLKVKLIILVNFLSTRTITLHHFFRPEQTSYSSWFECHGKTIHQISNQINIFKHEEKKCGKLICWTDRWTDRQSPSLKFPSTLAVGD